MDFNMVRGLPFGETSVVVGNKIDHWPARYNHVWQTGNAGAAPAIISSD
jgi:hypothetical protein